MRTKAAELGQGWHRARDGRARRGQKAEAHWQGLSKLKVPHSSAGFVLSYLDNLQYTILLPTDSVSSSAKWGRERELLVGVQNRTCISEALEWCQAQRKRATEGGSLYD